MTFRFGQGWVVQAPEDTTAGGGGEDTVSGAVLENHADDTIDGGADTLEGAAGDDSLAGADGEDKGAPPKDMKQAIDAALGYKAGEDKATAKPAEKKPEPKETDTHHANGKPKKGDKGEDLDADGKLVQKGAPKLKTAAELDLKPEEKRALHTKTQARFGEVITTLKAHEGTIAKLTDTNKTLSTARDALLGAMDETKTTQESLANFLEFNALLHSPDPKDWQRALDVVERQRVALYKALGKEPEGGGIDLLADFPDLKKMVDEEEVTRAAALELAQSRREKAAREETARRQQSAQSTEQQQRDQHKKESEAALSGIEKWTTGLSKSDLDYKAKEDKLLAKLDGVLKSYPPSQWLPTLKLLYEGIEIQRPAASGGPRPLRPSGAKPGDKAPASMQEAIDQGLGYARAGKG